MAFVGADCANCLLWQDGKAIFQKAQQRGRRVVLEKQLAIGLFGTPGFVLYWCKSKRLSHLSDTYRKSDGEISLRARNLRLEVCLHRRVDQFAICVRGVEAIAQLHLGRLFMLQGLVPLLLLTKNRRRGVRKLDNSLVVGIAPHH